MQMFNNNLTLKGPFGFILHSEELKIYKGPFGYQLSII